MKINTKKIGAIVRGSMFFYVGVTLVVACVVEEVKK